jgi:hypothetical protein
MQRQSKAEKADRHTVAYKSTGILAVRARGTRLKSKTLEILAHTTTGNNFNRKACKCIRFMALVVQVLCILPQHHIHRAVGMPSPQESMQEAQAPPQVKKERELWE